MTEVSIFCWNVQGDLGRFSISSQKIKNKLKALDSKFDIVCLQEFVDKKIVKQFAKENNYSIVMSKENKKTKKHYSYNIILSKFPLLEFGEILFTNFNVWEKESVIWATMKIGLQKLRLYNCHLQIFKVGMFERQEQIKTVYRHANNYQGSVVVCGDMNTTLPKKGLGRLLTQLVHKELRGSIAKDNEVSIKDERFAFAKIGEVFNFRDLLPINQPSWGLPFLHWEVFKLKLDWFLVRDINNAKAIFGDYYSDHRPISATINL